VEKEWGSSIEIDGNLENRLKINDLKTQSFRKFLTPLVDSHNASVVYSNIKSYTEKELNKFSFG
jgi:hypothetical protein